MLPRAGADRAGAGRLAADTWRAGEAQWVWGGWQTGAQYKQLLGSRTCSRDRDFDLLPRLSVGALGDASSSFIFVIRVDTYLVRTAVSERIPENIESAEFAV